MIHISRTIIFVVICCSYTLACLAQVSLPDGTNLNLSASDAKSILIQSASTNNVISLAIDSSGTKNIFDVVVLDSSAEVSMTLPNGAVINALNAEAQGIRFKKLDSETYTEAARLPSPLSIRGTHTLIELPASATAGSYQININASAVSADTVATVFHFTSSSIRTGVLVDSFTYKTGDTVVVSAFVFNGTTPLTNATVNALISEPSQLDINPITIALHDSGTFDDAPGDGIYTGSFTANQSGAFTASIFVTGTAPSGSLYSRFALTRFTVKQSLAKLGSFSYRAEDYDDNDLYEQLKAVVSVETQTAGQYQIGLTLAGSNGAEIKANEFVNLQQGNQLITLSFASKDILTLGVDGPYTAKNAVLIYQGDSDLSATDYKAECGSTAPYPLSSFFQKAAYQFTGPYTATGIDTNGNDRFDVLRIQAGVHVSQSTTYEWNGILTDAAGREIDFYSGSGLLPSGVVATITFEFSGSKIGQSGMNGPYSLRSVLLYSNTNTLTAEKVFDTQVFTVDQFEDSRQGDLLVTGSASSNQVAIGEEVTYSATVRNNGSSITTDVRLSDTLPEGLEFVSVTSNLGSCSNAGGTIRCVIGDLESGASASATIVVKPVAGGSFLNVVSGVANEADQNPGNNSSAFNLSVNTPPVISITAPANGATLRPAEVTITAEASDADGEVEKVEFFNQETKIGEATTYPYTFTWSDVTDGNYTITVKATDDFGAVATSSQVSFIVQSAIPWSRSSGPVGGNIRAIVKSNTALFAATAHGVYRSTDNGNLWSFAGQGMSDNYIGSLLSDGSALYAGAFNKVFRSGDNGNTWTNASTGLPEDVVCALTKSGTVVIAGTLYNGVLRSADGGQTWVPASIQPTNLEVRALTVNGATLYASTGGGAFISSDQGQTWSSANNGVINYDSTAMLNVGSNVYMGTYGGGVYLTSDSGQSWAPVNNGFDDPYTKYLAHDGTNLYVGSMFSSSDSGQSWSRMNFPPYIFVTSFHAEANNLFAGAEGTGIFRSTDQGQSWVNASAGIIHPELWDLAAHGSTVYAGTFGAGVSRSTDNGQTWTSINNGLESLNVQALAVSDSGDVYAGTYGGTIYYSGDQGNSWSALGPGQIPFSGTGQVAIKGTMLFAGTFGDGVYRSTDNGQNWVAVNNGLTEMNVSFVLATTSHIYAATPAGVFVSANNGTYWTLASTGLTNLNVRRLVASGSKILAGTEDGIFSSTDNGQTWTAANDGLLNTYVNKLVVSGSYVYAATGGGLYVSNNNGGQWTEITNDGLLDAFIPTVAASESVIFGGTIGHGVFTRPVQF